MASKIFAELLKQVEPEDSQFVAKNLAISRQVRHILASHPTIKNQKALAEALGKEPSEISKWLSGLHNIGLENITKMETILGHDIILTVEQAKERFAEPVKEKYTTLETITQPEQIVRSGGRSFGQKNEKMLSYAPAKQPLLRDEKVEFA